MTYTAWKASTKSPTRPMVIAGGVLLIVGSIWDMAGAGGQSSPTREDAFLALGIGTVLVLLWLAPLAERGSLRAISYILTMAVVAVWLSKLVFGEVRMSTLVMVAGGVLASIFIALSLRDLKTRGFLIILTVGVLMVAGFLVYLWPPALV